MSHLTYQRHTSTYINDSIAVGCTNWWGLEWGEKNQIASGLLQQVNAGEERCEIVNIFPPEPVD